MQRATTRGALRDELIRQHGRDDAFVILTRLGYLAGQEDAEFIRQAWPALDPGDAFTAGTRLHMLKGEFLTTNQSPVTGSTLENVAQGLGMAPHSPGPHKALMDILEQSLEQGGFAIDDLNRQICRMTIRRAEGNVAQAARMLGLSRPQFAYRLGQINTAASG